MNVPRSIPLAPGALPVLGHIGPLLRDPWAFLNGLPAHGQLVRIRVGPEQSARLDVLSLYWHFVDAVWVVVFTVVYVLGR